MRLPHIEMLRWLNGDNCGRHALLLKWRRRLGRRRRGVRLMALGRGPAASLQSVSIAIEISWRPSINSACC
jgi:hypothetical protein